MSAFAKHHQFRRDLLVVVAVSKSSLTSPDAHTPTRRPADTLPSRRLYRKFTLARAYAICFLNLPRGGASRHVNGGPQQRKGCDSGLTSASASMNKKAHSSMALPSKFSFSFSKFPEGGLILAIVVLGILLAVFGGSVQLPKFQNNAQGKPERVFETTPDGQKVPAFETVNKFFNPRTLNPDCKGHEFLCDHGSRDDRCHYHRRNRSFGRRYLRACLGLWGAGPDAVRVFWWYRRCDPWSSRDRRSWGIVRICEWSDDHGFQRPPVHHHLRYDGDLSRYRVRADKRTVHRRFPGSLSKFRSARIQRTKPGSRLL